MRKFRQGTSRDAFVNFTRICASRRRGVRARRSNRPRTTGDAVESPRALVCYAAGFPCNGAEGLYRLYTLLFFHFLPNLPLPQLDDATFRPGHVDFFYFTVAQYFNGLAQNLSV